MESYREFYSCHAKKKKQKKPKKTGRCRKQCSICGCIMSPYMGDVLFLSSVYPSV